MKKNASFNILATEKVKNINSFQMVKCIMDSIHEVKMQDGISDYYKFSCLTMVSNGMFKRKCWMFMKSL